MRAFTFHCFTRGDLTLFQVFLWCFGLFVLFVCWSFAVCGCVVLSLTILRSGSCLPEHGREETKRLDVCALTSCRTNEFLCSIKKF